MCPTFILYPKALPKIAIMSASWINTALWFLRFLRNDLKNTYEVEFLTFTQRWLWKWKQNHSIFNSIFIYNYWLLYCVYFHALKTPRRLVVLWHHRVKVVTLPLLSHKYMTIIRIPYFSRRYNKGIGRLIWRIIQYDVVLYMKRRISHFQLEMSTQ